ncbi:hypothetical protein [Microbacterium sp. NPDC056052]|uniref:hypothetical protein n=1 Tax=Microbacterium sp. NPDC056052 TaxID=3345695 RepID=UPI0035E1FC7E
MFDPNRMPPEVLAQLLEPAALAARPEDAKNVAIRQVRLSNFTLMQSVNSTGTFSYAPSAEVGANRYVFGFVSKGELSIAAAEDRYVAAENNVIICFPSTESITCTAITPVDLLGFGFEAEEVAPLTLAADRVGVLRMTSPLVLGSYSMLRALVNRGVEESVDDKIALRTMLRNAARSLMEAAQPTGSSTWSLASTIIDQQHTNPLLDARQIASQLNVSESALFKAFAGRPRSLTDQLRYTRTETAARLLTAIPDMSRAALATASGFQSTRTLTRALSRYDFSSVETA